VRGFEAMPVIHLGLAGTVRFRRYPDPLGND
jgi:hypothetical protein